MLFDFVFIFLEDVLFVILYIFVFELKNILLLVNLIICKDFCVLFLEIYLCIFKLVRGLKDEKIILELIKYGVEFIGIFVVFGIIIWELRFRDGLILLFKFIRWLLYIL